MNIRALWGKAITRAQSWLGKKEKQFAAPTEYQLLVAQKAGELLLLIQQSDLKNRFVEMQKFLEKVQQCKVPLPNQELSGWFWYFVYENPERLDLKYPEISNTKAALSYMMDFATRVRYEQAKAEAAAHWARVKP